MADIIYIYIFIYIYFYIYIYFNKSCSDYGDNGCKGTSTELTIQI